MAFSPSRSAMSLSRVHSVDMGPLGCHTDLEVKTTIVLFILWHAAVSVLFIKVAVLMLTLKKRHIMSENKPVIKINLYSVQYLHHNWRIWQSWQTCGLQGKVGTLCETMARPWCVLRPSHGPGSDSTCWLYPAGCGRTPTGSCTVTAALKVGFISVSWAVVSLGVWMIWGMKQFGNIFSKHRKSWYKLQERLRISTFSEVRFWKKEHLFIVQFPWV